MTTTAYVQEDLFPGLPAPWLPSPGWVYAAHMFQRTGDPFWKLGYTEASVYVRARQIACVAVAWTPGAQRDERQLHRMWKRSRVSPAAEFFRHSYALDQHVLAMIKQMPATLQDRQLEIYDQIMQRYRRENPGKAA